MSNKTLKILIVAAAILIVIGICGIVIALLLGGGADTVSDTPEPDVTTHAPEEYLYNDDGSVASVLHYKDNVYSGRTDYYTDTVKNVEYVMVFDADDNEIESEKTEHNSDGAVSYYSKKLNGKLVQSVEYSYYADSSKLKKKTTKEYDEDGNENAEKLYYYENGKVSQRCSFINGEMTSQIFYDEEGNEYIPE